MVIIVKLFIILQKKEVLSENSIPCQWFSPSGRGGEVFYETGKWYEQQDTLYILSHALENYDPGIVNIQIIELNPYFIVFPFLFSKHKFVLTAIVSSG
jgi:hypothetical protein